jgi:hypothetical protein
MKPSRKTGPSNDGIIVKQYPLPIKAFDTSASTQDSDRSPHSSTSTLELKAVKLIPRLMNMAVAITIMPCLLMGIFEAWRCQGVDGPFMVHHNRPAHQIILIFIATTYSFIFHAVCVYIEFINHLLIRKLVW